MNYSEVFMRRLVLFISLLFGLLLVACGSGATAETAVSADTTASDASAPVPVESKPVDPNRLYAVSDLNQVANTGRPQFLNSFANW